MVISNQNYGKKNDNIFLVEVRNFESEFFEVEFLLRHIEVAFLIEKRYYFFLSSK